MVEGTAAAGVQDAATLVSGLAGDDGALLWLLLALGVLIVLAWLAGGEREG